MRGKLFGVFAVVVLVVVGLSYALTSALLGDAGAPAGDASRMAVAVNAQLELDALILERWLTERAADPKTREPFNAGTPEARQQSAIDVATKLRDAAATFPAISPMSPSLVVLVDPAGIVLGRNGTQTMRGDDLGAAYPALKEALTKGVTGSDVWVSQGRNEQMLASYAPIRGESGAIVGGLVIGTALNDGRLAKVLERLGGGSLALVAKRGDSVDVIAKSASDNEDVAAFIGSPSAKEGLAKALATGQAIDLAGVAKDVSAVCRPLQGYGDGRRAVLVAVAKAQTSNVGRKILLPSLGVAALGLILVALAAFLLDGYLSRPIAEMEEGLLAIMNGKTDMRFEIEHAELGGLVFRINSLLNQLFGVQEDETDEQGRPSRAPTSTAFEGALSVDERMATSTEGGDANAADIKSLREEAEETYYARIFREYIAGKRSLGDPVDHITREAFITRIRASELETAQKHGKPVRYKVEVRDREVVLLAVPLV